MNKVNLNKLNSIISEEKSGWLEKALWREENEAWLDISFEIAVEILDALRENKKNKIFPKTQKELAEAMNCSPQYINKVLKGAENLQLETITKIGKILNIQLVEVPKSVKLTPQVTENTVWASEAFDFHYENTKQKIFIEVKKGFLQPSISKSRKIIQKGIAYNSLVNKFTFEEDFDNDPNSPLKIVA